MKIEEQIPLLESILGDWEETMGSDYKPYKNHVYRVVHFCLALHQCRQDDKEKFIIAGCFHDLGIWANETLDYLAPSAELAKQYLKAHGQEQWSTEIELMIDQHHKVTRYRDSMHPLVEVFRKADWIDVTMGRRTFGLPKNDVQSVLDKFPNLGFHKMLIKLAKAQFMRHPLNLLPMIKW